MPIRVKVQFKVEMEKEYGEDVTEALDTLAHSNLRLDTICGAIELRRSHYKRWEDTEALLPPSAEDAIGELTTGRPRRKRDR